MKGRKAGCQIKEVGNGEPLKVLELGSDVCTPGL